MTDFLIDGVGDAPVLLLAHGAGAPMDSDFMTDFAGRLATRGLVVKRFEFTYMAVRRKTGRNLPPPRAETLAAQFVAAIEDAGDGPLFIGGKSMGGRVASLVAEQEFQAGRVRGLVCLGYPFHPPGKPDKLRTAHLESLQCPTLIVQGERDPFGTRPEVERYALSPALRFHWVANANHDLTAPKRLGPSREQTWTGAVDAIAGFVERNT